MKIFSSGPSKTLLSKISSGDKDNIKKNLGHFNNNFNCKMGSVPGNHGKIKLSRSQL